MSSQHAEHVKLFKFHLVSHMVNELSRSLRFGATQIRKTVTVDQIWHSCLPQCIWNPATSNIHKYAAYDAHLIIKFYHFHIFHILWFFHSFDSFDSSVHFLNESLQSLGHDERTPPRKKNQTENGGEKKWLKTCFGKKRRKTKKQKKSNAKTSNLPALGARSALDGRALRPCEFFCSERSFTPETTPHGSIRKHHNISWMKCKRKWCQTPQRCHGPNSQGGKQSKIAVAIQVTKWNGTSKSNIFIYLTQLPDLTQTS